MPKRKTDLVINPIGTLVSCGENQGDPLLRLTNAYLAITGEQIVGLGPSRELDAWFDTSQAQVIDARFNTVVPGFVDSHTHTVFGGSRVQEYTARFTQSPEEVHASGIPAGILATVKMTRSESREMLTDNAIQRLDQMLAHGTTTVESKSGYGLTVLDELKILEVNRQIQSDHPIDVRSTFLGAHAIPPELPRETYVQLILDEMLPEVADRGLAEFCDVYCDEGYFSVEDSRKILEAAGSAGLKLKIHTDQYSDLGGSKLAADLSVVSADHLNFTGRNEARSLAESGVIGVLMPLIDFAVEHPHPFDARMIINEGMSIALATDLCPGCWAVSMPLVIQFACRRHHLSTEEAFAAATLGGAQALDLRDRGRLAPGLMADIQIWDLPRFEDAFYRLGHNPVTMVIKSGRIVFRKGEKL